MSWLCTMASKRELRVSRSLAVRRSPACSRILATISSGLPDP